MTWIITKFRLGFLSTLFKVQNHRTIFDRIVSRGSGASNNTIFLSEIIISNSRWHCQKSRTTENLFWLLVSKLQNKLQDKRISTCFNLSTWSVLNEVMTCGYEVMMCQNFKHLSLSTFEADDVFATLACRKLETSRYPVLDAVDSVRYCSMW